MLADSKGVLTHPFALFKLANSGIFALVIRGFPQFLLTQIIIRDGMNAISSCLVLDRNVFW